MNDTIIFLVGCFVVLLSAIAAALLVDKMPFD